MSEFQKFPKITRFFDQDVIVTEKIDGTNSLVFVSEDLKMIKAGSRSRWITPEDDNYGFAKWVEENKDDLKNLGPGYHYGEWWGQGIQRKYGMSVKVFSLFNSSRWSDKQGNRPKCCDVVPLLFQGSVNDLVTRFEFPNISKAAEKYGVTFEKPEGYMIYFSKEGSYFKVPLNK